MTSEEYEAFHRALDEKQGVHTHAHQVAKEGKVLMVQGLQAPRYCVPYPSFVRQLREARGEIPTEAQPALTIIAERGLGGAALEAAVLLAEM